MKALTVRQPYAHLIASGEQWVENLKYCTLYRGPIAIHAGRSRDALSLDSSNVDDSGIPLVEMAFGAVVAVADLVDCIHIANVRGQKRWEEKYPGIRAHLHTQGPYCLVLKKPVRLVNPFTVSGPTGSGVWVLDGHRFKAHIKAHWEAQAATAGGKRELKRMVELFGLGAELAAAGG